VQIHYQLLKIHLMKPILDNYKYIDKGTQLLFSEKDTFKVLHLVNLSTETQKYLINLDSNYIQIYLCNSSHCKVAFNFEHCAIDLIEGNSSMVYFKDEKMNVYVNLPPESNLISILISVEYFHSLFSLEDNFLFNFGNFKIGKPIIEPKTISNPIKLILNQLTSNQISESLKPVYIKGKVYELLSHYFSISEENGDEFCPYITDSETIAKIKRVKEIIIEELATPPSLNELAKEVGLNIKKLKTDFKEFYGSPVFTFLLNYKMELAKNLLHEQGLNVNEIAVKLGYSTSSHFIAAFKRKYSITPKQFAKSL